LGQWDGGIMGIVSLSFFLSFFLSLLLSFVLDKWGLLFWEGGGGMLCSLLEQGNWMGWDGMGWLGLRGWPYVLGKDHSYTFLSPYVEKSSLHRPDMLQAKSMRIDFER